MEHFWSVADALPGVALGVLLLIHRRVVIGMTLIGLGSTALLGIADLGSAPGDPSSSGALTAILLAGGWIWQFMPPALLAALMPDGHLEPRWRWLWWGWLPCLALFWAGIVLDPDTYGTRDPLFDVPQGLYYVGFGGLALLFALIVGSVAHLGVRFTAGSAMVRRQLKWLLAVLSLVPLSLMLIWIAILAGWGIERVAILPHVWYIGVPVAVAVAVLRHDVVDIDTLASRTIAYVFLTALLLALYTVVVLAGGVVFGRGSSIATAAAALACAMGFGLVHRRLQRWADRWFDRGKSETLARIEAFVDDVRSGRAEPEEIEFALQEAMGDPLLRIFYRDASGWVDSAGAIVDKPDGLHLDVATRGRVLASVSYSDDADRRDALFREALRAAHLPLELAHSRQQLARALVEVADSRSRLVEAATNERRRLERNLHDGAQQRLVAIGMSLGALAQDLDQPAAEVLSSAVRNLQATIVELRRLASGLRPDALDEGIEAALRHLVAGSPVPVSVRVSTLHRLPEVTATTCFYVVAESVTNALKHALATALSVEVTESPEHRVRVSVSDDGIGGADPASGTGLTGLSDRVVAVGGQLLIRSRPDEGTHVEAVIPCAS